MYAGKRRTRSIGGSYLAPVSASFKIEMICAKPFLCATRAAPWFRGDPVAADRTRSRYQLKEKISNVRRSGLPKPGSLCCSGTVDQPS